MEQAADLPELLYIFDPLCTWCYGMGTVVQQAQQQFAGQVTVAVLCGGMITGDEVGPIGQSWGFLRNALPQVEQVTGAQFGDAFRQLGEAGQQIMNSEPPSRAIAVFRQLDATEKRTAQFARDVQTALFRDGHDLNDPATYSPLLASYGLDADKFLAMWAAPALVQAVQQEFATAGRLGIQGFPTSVLRVGNAGYVLARGFQPYPTFADGLTQALQQAQEEE